MIKCAQCGQFKPEEQFSPFQSSQRVCVYCFEDNRTVKTSPIPDFRAQPRDGQIGRAHV